MSAMSVETANFLHEYSRTLTVRYHRVDHELFRQFSRQHRRLLQLLGDSAGDDYWGAFLAALRWCRTMLSAAPLPFNHPAVAPAMGETTMRTFAARTARAYPSLAEEVGKVVDLLLKLRSCRDNPLLDALETQVGPCSGSTVVLVRQNRLIDAVQDSLDSRVSTQGFEAIGIEAARDLAPVDRVILIGSIRWYPSHVLAAPKAHLAEVVSYKWNGSRWRAEQAFLGGNARNDDEPLGQYDEDDAELDEDWPKIDWEGIARRAAASGAGNDNDAEAQEQVEARLFSLDGGGAVFLHAADGAKSLVIDPRESGDCRVKRIETDEIEPGMFVLLRTEGGGDLVAPVANRLLGEKRARESRDAQDMWKKRLRDQVRHKGALRVSLDLIERGSHRANEINVRNWMSDRTIGTQEKNDFAAIMGLVGLGTETERYWGITRQLRAAHLRAGRKIGDWLVAQVRTVNLRDLDRKGQMDFVLSDAVGGRLTAFRVEGRSPTRTWVLASRVDRAFQLEAEA